MSLRALLLLSKLICFNGSLTIQFTKGRYIYIIHPEKDSFKINTFF